MPIILTISCEAHRGAEQQAVRDTWRHLSMGWPFEQKFLLGRNSKEPQWDEWVLDADDTHAGIQEKVRAAFRRCEEEGLDHAFLCCNDTYIVPCRMQMSGYRHYDYTGSPCPGGGHARGGDGYWVSPGARYYLAREHLVPGQYADVVNFHTLLANKIPLHVDTRYGTSITKHLSRGTGNYDPQWMRDLHKHFMEQPL
jgi:hypothetical protein